MFAIRRPSGTHRRCGALGSSERVCHFLQVGAKLRQLLLCALDLKVASFKTKAVEAVVDAHGQVVAAHRAEDDLLYAAERERQTGKTALQLVDGQSAINL